MKDADRQEMFDRLMEGATQQTNGDAVALRLFEESTLEDLDNIEPIFDRIILRERADAAKRVLELWNQLVATEVLEAFEAEELASTASQPVSTASFLPSANSKDRGN